MKLSDRGYALLLLTPASFFIGVFLIYPLVLLLFQSTHEMTILAPAERTYVGLSNFRNVLILERFGGAAFRTVIYTAVALGIEFLIGFVAALFFHRLGRRSEIARTIFLLPLMIPPIVAGLLWRFMLIDKFGIVNWILYWIKILPNPSAINWLGDKKIALYATILPNIWLTTCFVTLVIYAGLQNISEELTDAAKVDGASSTQIFRYITLPLLRPVIAVVLIIRGLDAARTFDMIWIMTEGGPRFASETLSLYTYKMMIRYGKIGLASATATIFMVVLLCFSLAMFYSVWKPQQRIR